MGNLVISLPAFGAYIEGQGGHFVGIMRGPIIDGAQEPPYALLASTASAGEFENVEWGAYSKDVADANSHSDGLSNTTAMLARDCPAALRARQVTADGHSDFYLPALGELAMAKANAPELFSKKGWYWSSTQDSPDYAFIQGFEDGYSGAYGKDGEYRARAFRRIPLQHFAA